MREEIPVNAVHLFHKSRDRKKWIPNTHKRAYPKDTGK